MRIKFLIIIVLLALSSGVVLGFDLQDWKYHTEIVIKENSGKDLRDYQVLIELNSTNFDFSKAKSDGSDVRFVDEKGDELPYWIEEWDSANKKAKIWVKVPLIPANGKTKIYMYYGNPNAVSKSNGDAVFEFFDDFNKGLDKWINFGSPTPTTFRDSSFHDGWGYSSKGDSWHPSGSYSKRLVYIKDGITVEARARVAKGCQHYGFLTFGIGTVQKGYSERSRLCELFAICISGESAMGQYIFYGNTYFDGGGQIKEPNDFKFHRYTMKYDPITQNVTYYRDGKYICSINIHKGRPKGVDVNDMVLHLPYEVIRNPGSNPFDKLPLLIGGRDCGNINYLDYIFVRKYAKQEPTVTVVTRLEPIAIRDLPDDVKVDEIFKVRIKVSNYGMFGQVIEQLPKEFEFIGSNLPNYQVDYNPKEHKIIFTLFGEKEIIYKVKARKEGAYILSGYLLDEYKNKHIIKGDNEVVVTAQVPSMQKIYFYVDGKLVAVLNSSWKPEVKPVIIGGRSAGHTDSGLADNIEVYIDGKIVMRDDFSSLNNWIGWGQPRPDIVSNDGNPPPCLRTNGDSWYDSGVVSRQKFDWSCKWYIKIDGKVSHPYEHFNDFGFGIAKRDRYGDEEPAPAPQTAIIGLRYRAKLDEPAWHFLVWTDKESKVLDNLFAKPEFYGKWHTFIISNYPIPKPTPPPIITIPVHLAANKKEVAPGEEFNIDIVVNGKDVKSVLVNFTYPDSVSVVDTKTYGVFDFTDKAITGNGYVKYLGISLRKLNLSGKTIATITFKVNSDAKPGDLIKLNVTVASINGTLVSSTADTIKIVSEPWQMYDKNGNGKIDDLELLSAIMDWLHGKLSDSDLLKVILVWLKQSITI